MSTETGADEGTETGTDEGTKTPERVYCWACGERIDARAEVCPHCGVRQRRAGTIDEALRRNSPVVAALASFLFPGLGQIYNREIEKGLVLMVLFLVSLASIVVLVGVLATPVVWLYAIYDAYTTAERRGSEYGG